MTLHPDLPIHPGDVLFGKYRIERILGAGGMGAVVEATHLGLERRVAMKFMLPEVADHAANLERFMHEARAASKLHSEHIPKVLDFGTIEQSIPNTQSVPYLVMELLEGQDLERMIRDASPLDIAEVCEVGIQACEALSEAHGLGIVHRDIKPANMFITRRADGSPCTKVLDFGIAKKKAEAGSLDEKGLTETGAMMGSPDYMSPEQFESARRADVRSDIWSLGAALYQALTGKPPFEADNLAELVMMIMDNDAESPSTARPDIPVALGNAILKCLQRQPADRYQNTFELAVALAPFAPARCQVLLDRIAANCHVTMPTKRGTALLEALDRTVVAPSERSASNPTSKSANMSTDRSALAPHPLAPSPTTHHDVMLRGEGEKSVGSAQSSKTLPSQKAPTPPASDVDAQPLAKTHETWAKSRSGKRPSAARRWAPYVIAGACGGVVVALYLHGTSRAPQPPAVASAVAAPVPTHPPSAAPAPSASESAMPAVVAPSSSPAVHVPKMPAPQPSPSKSGDRDVLPNYGGRK
ncbi:MAG: serine/threonine protein kinase [Polyangiaceae bacterium]|nr:serine/threonine protein kinase [Polyangiaceae bacterium]